MAVLEWDILTNDTQLESFEGGSVLTEDIVNLQLDTAVVDAAATYTIEFINLVTGCMANQEIVVNPIDDIAIADVIPMNPLCFEEATGLIEVLVEKMAQWSSHGRDPHRRRRASRRLVAGDYTVVVTSEVGCQDTASVTLFDPDELVVAVLDVMPSECGEANGYVIASALGGSGTISHLGWALTVSRLKRAFSICWGLTTVYTFRAEDENGCVSDTTVNVQCIPLQNPSLPSSFHPTAMAKTTDGPLRTCNTSPTPPSKCSTDGALRSFKMRGHMTRNGTAPTGAAGCFRRRYFYVIDTKKKSQRPFNGYLELQTNQP